MTDPIIPPYPADARGTSVEQPPSDDAAEVVAESLPFVVEAPAPNAPLPGIAPAMRRVEGGYVREDAHPGVGEEVLDADDVSDLREYERLLAQVADAVLTTEARRARDNDCWSRIPDEVKYLKAAESERDSLRAEMAEVRSREEKLRTAKFLLEQEFQQRDASESLGAFERKMGKPLGNPDVYVVPVGVMCEALAALRADLSPPRPRAGKPAAPASTGTGGEEAKALDLVKFDLTQALRWIARARPWQMTREQMQNTAAEALRRAGVTP